MDLPDHRQHRNIEMADFDTSQQNVVDPNQTDDDENLVNKTSDQGPGINAKSLADTLQKSRKNVEALEGLANDPDYASKAPQGSQASLKQAISDARDLYTRKANQNDWLDVAQTLGRAVAQFAGAQRGLSSGNSRYGTNMSNLDMGAPIDYNARSARAMQEYQQDIKNAKEANDIDRQQYLDDASEKKAEYDRLSGAYKEGASVYDAQGRTIAGELSANARANRANKAQSDRDDRQLRQMNASDLDKQAKTLADQIRSGQELANNLGQEEDLNTKDADKLKAKYGALAGKAGVDLPSAMEQYQANAPKRNREIFGVGIPGTETTDTKNPQTRQSLFDALGISDKMQQLQDIRDKKAKLLQGKNAQPSQGDDTQPAGKDQGTNPPDQSSDNSPQDNTSPTTVQVQGPSGQIAEMTPDKAHKYLGKPGYKILKQ